MLLKDGPFKIDINAVDYNDPQSLKALITHLANLAESLYQQNLALKAENQKLKDEINRLKGQKGKPHIKPKVPAKTSDASMSSAEEQNPKKQWSKDTKRDKIRIDEIKTVPYEGPLPSDAEYKGNRSVIVQGISITTHNIEYQLQRFYSPSEKKTYEAALPDGIEGEFHPELLSWVVFWYFHSRMSQDKIHQLLTALGVRISRGQLSNIIINCAEPFHKEKQDIVEAGLKSTDYQHIDDTGGRLKGANEYFSTLCNEYYSAFFMKPKKDRLTIIEILSQTKELSFLINDLAMEFLKQRNLKTALLRPLGELQSKGPMNREAFEHELKRAIPNLKKSHKNIILEAAAIAGYQENNAVAVVQRLVCDDAKQFHYVTFLRALCWIHEERHYAKLTPLLHEHQVLLDDFRLEIWAFYDQLKAYKKNPTEAQKQKLSEWFDDIFSQKTGYDELDKRIELTRAKKDALLVVLDYPDTPLHNNPAELALRMYVIKRKISFGNRSEEGAKSWETFFSILDTCRKLKVNFRDYLYDRLAKRYKMPSLASLIPTPA